MHLRQPVQQFARLIHPCLMDNDPTTGSVPLALVKGVPMLKITSKKIKQVVVRLRGDTITWTSRIGGRGRFYFDFGNWGSSMCSRRQRNSRTSNRATAYRSPSRRSMADHSLRSECAVEGLAHDRSDRLFGSDNCGQLVLSI